MLDSRKPHLFTVDVEDWYHGSSEPEVRRNSTSRLHVGLNKLLEMMARTGARGTFFWLGAAARENPALIRATAQAGHEIGCHGWNHDFVCRMTPEQFLTDTRQATDMIADLVGSRPIAYRAPYFSVTGDSLWMLEALAELGYEVDSSIVPIRAVRYGISGFPRRRFVVDTPHGRIEEWPLTVRDIGPLTLPACGGSYTRLYPYAALASNFRALEASREFAGFYIHPWELDLDRPRPKLTWLEQIVQTLADRPVDDKLRRLLDEFRFVSIRDMRYAATSASPPQAVPLSDLIDRYGGR
jgi:polysaccharide deacetylase family protein (PEP-CTERM system associated)